MHKSSFLSPFIFVALQCCFFGQLLGNVKDLGTIPALTSNYNVVHGLKIYGESLSKPFLVDTVFVQNQSPLCNPPNVVLGTDEISNISCFGLSDGKINALSLEPVGSVIFTLNGEMNESGFFTGLNKGTDTLLATGSDGCFVKLPFEIKEPDTITFIGDVTAAPCENLKGSIVTETQGGTLPYNFEWFSLGQLVSSQKDLMDVEATSYAFFVTDANGCSVTKNFNIPVLAGLNLQAEMKEPRCRWEANGSLAALIEGGKEPYDISWYDTVFISKDLILDSIRTGYYKMVVQDSIGCIDSMTYFVPNPEKVEADFEVMDVGCFGDKNGSVVVKAKSGVPPYLYRQFGFPQQTSRVFFKLPPGLQQYEITDSRGCRSEVFRVEVGAPDSFSVSAPSNIIVPFGEIISLNPHVTGGTPSFSWLWSANINLDDFCEICYSQSIEVTQDILLNVSAIDANGCIAETDIVVEVKNDRKILVPTGFTPNGDLINDELLVHGSDSALVLSFQVFDRWGGVVFSKSDFNPNELKGWDGKIDQNEALPGVYIWKARAVFRDGSKLNFSGETNLLR